MIGNSNFGIFVLRQQPVLYLSPVLSAPHGEEQNPRALLTSGVRKVLSCLKMIRVLLLSAFEGSCCQATWPVNNECSLIYFPLLDDSCLIAWSILWLPFVWWPPAPLLCLFVLRKRRAKSESLCFPQLWRWGGNATDFFKFASVFKIKISCSIFCDNPESINIETTDSSLETEGLICE